MSKKKRQQCQLLGSEIEELSGTLGTLPNHVYGDVSMDEDQTR